MKKGIRVFGTVVAVKQDMPESEIGHEEYRTPVTKLGDSGIVIPASAYERGGNSENFTGEVIAVGDQVTRFVKGDKVYFTKNGPTGMYINGQCFLLVEEDGLPMKVFNPEEGESLEADQFIVEEKGTKNR